jgi:hypothetical protein
LPAKVTAGDIHSSSLRLQSLLKYDNSTAASVIDVGLQPLLPTPCPATAVNPTSLLLPSMLCQFLQVFARTSIHFTSSWVRAVAPAAAAAPAATSCKYFS